MLSCPVADDTVAETLEVQSNTITELMAVRENLTAKLRRAQDTCRKLEVERTSVFESLRELPSESLCFDQVDPHAANRACRTETWADAPINGKRRDPRLFK